MDLYVAAPTGSGKTVAYAVPVIQMIHNRIVPRIRAVVVVPTRELARQVSQTFQRLTAGSKLSFMCLNAANATFASETTALHRNTTDIIVSTPGRLIDHLTASTIDLNHLQCLVLDEADRLLSQNYQGWLLRLIKHSRPATNDFKLSLSSSVPLQKLVFSATLTTDPAILNSLQLHSPQFIKVASSDKSALFSIPATLTERMLVVKEADKPLATFSLLQDCTGMLIFVKSVESAHRLASLLNRMNTLLHSTTQLVMPYTSDLCLSDKQAALTMFLNGGIRALVCSDIMTRGLDLGETVQHILNYHIPPSAKTYVHRLGRTARAGRQGIGTTFVSASQVKWFWSTLANESVIQRGSCDKGNAVERMERLDWSVWTEVYHNALKSMREPSNPQAGGNSIADGVDSSGSDSDTTNSDIDSSGSDSDTTDGDSDTEMDDSSLTNSENDAKKTSNVSKPRILNPFVPIATKCNSVHVCWGDGW